MKLLLDVGNTRCKWRLMHDAIILDQGHWPSAEPCPDAWHRLPVPLSVHGACVASLSVQIAIEACCRRLWGLDVSWLQVLAACCGVRNLYQPDSLGPDRWASIIAAHHAPWAGGQAALAVNAGTALTIDAVTAAGDYLGGCIVPGLHLMRAALAEHTARLPMADGEVQDFPRRTVDAICSGAVDAACGAILRMVSRFQGPVHVLLSGGDADILAAYLPVPAVKVENLVLDGLQVITR